MEASLKDRTEHIREEYQKLNEEENDFKPKRAINEDEKSELTKLYRKLALKFHPDLANGDEEIMKKINKAYTEGDLESLRSIENQSEMLVDEGIQTIETLQIRAAMIDKTIKKLREEYRKLRESEWFLMNENIELAKKQGRGFLDELAEKIKSDISKKEMRLRELKDSYERK